MVYRQLYTGIDLHYTGTNGQLKTTYVVAPGADPGRIRWRYQGASETRVDAQGNLVVTLPAPAEPVTGTTVLSSTLVEHAPLAWQTIDEREVLVGVRYEVAPSGDVRFVLDGYDPSQPLIIDPTLSYSTLLGGGGDDSGRDIAVDDDGNTYIVGTTDSSTFPTTTFSTNLITSNPYQGTKSGGADAFVTKLNSTGSALLYSTFLGSSGADAGNDIALDIDAVERVPHNNRRGTDYIWRQWRCVCHEAERKRQRAGLQHLPGAQRRRERLWHRRGQRQERLCRRLDLV
jgi:hypothetical protein